jgi:hypothetical protein
MPGVVITLLVRQLDGIHAYTLTMATIPTARNIHRATHDGYTLEFAMPNTQVLHQSPFNGDETMNCDVYGVSGGPLLEDIARFIIDGPAGPIQISVTPEVSMVVTKNEPMTLKQRVSKSVSWALGVKG